MRASFGQAADPMAERKSTASRPVAENRRARYDYFIDETVEAGIVLEGSEVKALREGKANIAESYAAVEDGELWLKAADCAWLKRGM